MKLFEMEGFLRGKCLPGDMKVNETNAEYLVRKFAEADARCAAVAAENAALKSALEWLYETVSSDCVSIPDEKYSSVTNAAQALSGTPATDAILAEVRASGVEMFALMYAEEAIKSDSISTGWRARASKAASEYAAQLRQEAK